MCILFVSRQALFQPCGAASGHNVRGHVRCCCLPPQTRHSTAAVQTDARFGFAFCCLPGHIYVAQAVTVVWFGSGTQSKGFAAALSHRPCGTALDARSMQHLTDWQFTRDVRYTNAICAPVIKLFCATLLCDSPAFSCALLTCVGSASALTNATLVVWYYIIWYYQAIDSCRAGYPTAAAWSQETVSTPTFTH